MRVKMLKYVDDPCFGQHYESESNNQCEKCWIKKACNVAWKNRKD